MYSGENEVISYCEFLNLFKMWGIFMMEEGSNGLVVLSYESWGYKYCIKGS